VADVGTRDGTGEDARRSLPSIGQLLETETARRLLQEFPRATVVDAIRSAVADSRERATGEPPSPETLLANASARLARGDEPSLRPVVNATGIILHTNLGRAPLSAAAIRAMERLAQGYSSLEFDLQRGARGSRHGHVSDLLCSLTGAEAALVVNNNASAVLLALAALAAGREVVISRGQLVEIGGGFRIPDVLRQSGARLVEVGTTNRTYAEDYAAALTDETAVLLRVHASNFRVVGFTHSASIEDLAAIAHRHGRLLVDDLGSGSLLPTERFGLGHEPMPQESVRAGADVVCFSGDKLLGGPQAGILVGGEQAIAAITRHPLTRALRPDKVTLAGLRATLAHYVRQEAETAIPVWRMISATPDELGARASAIARAAGSPFAHVADSTAAVGGGSLPGEVLPSFAVALEHPTRSCAQVAEWLRHWSPPIVARVAHDRVLLDVRTIAPNEDQFVADAIEALASW